MKKAKVQIQHSLLLTLLSFLPALAEAKLTVLTTVPDLRVLVSEIGAHEVEVSSIAKGTQDPHYIEAKPSYMSKASRADLVIAVGLELEIGYLPPILQGARNPKLMPGSLGYLEAGTFIDPLEVPTGKVSRAEGDVHPFGNPHFLLDPIRAGKVALGIAERLGKLDPSHAAQFLENAKKIQDRLIEKTKIWQERLHRTGIKQAVTYHKTLDYFFDRFHIEAAAILEPKPGIPPTAAHTLEVIDLIRERKIPLILIENFFDPTIGNRIRSEIPSVRVSVVPVMVEGASSVNSLDDLYEQLVKSIEGKS